MQSHNAAQCCLYIVPTSLLVVIFIRITTGLRLEAESWFGSPRLDESIYRERLAYRLYYVVLLGPVHRLKSLNH